MVSDDSMFTIVPWSIAIVAVLVFGLVGAIIFSAISETIRVSRLPIEEAPAHVVAKRQDTSGMGDSSVSTSYFVTFEFSGGRREELRTPPKEYGLLAEGDLGMLTYQGPKFLGFDRRRV